MSYLSICFFFSLFFFVSRDWRSGVVGVVTADKRSAMAVTDCGRVYDCALRVGAGCSCYSVVVIATCSCDRVCGCGGGGGRLVHVPPPVNI